MKNNSSWKSGTTGSNGEFTTTYTCSEWGLTTFSANNVSLQIKVKGFKSKSMWNGTLYYDDEKVEYWVNYAPTTTLQVHNSWTDSEAFDVVPEVNSKTLNSSGSISISIYALFPLLINIFPCLIR